MVAALAALVAASPSVSAAVVPWQSLEEMTERASVIVLGTVDSVEAAWSDDGRVILSRVTVDVERPLKGGPRRQAQFEVPGGRVGDRIMVASGAPVFRKGEQVVLFLEPGGEGGARLGVVGWSQGKFSVRRDPASGRDLVRDATAGTALLDRDGRPIPDRSGRGPRELGEFLGVIEDLVGRGPAGGGWAR